MDNILGLVITDGVGYRNFILSNFLVEATKKFEKIIIYSGIPKENYTEIGKSQKVEIIELFNFKEGKTTWFFRKLKEVAHLYKHRNYFGINYNLGAGYPKKNNKRALAVKIIYKISSIFHSEKWINFYEILQFYSFKNHKATKNYQSLLLTYKPSIILFTHQRPPYIAPFLYTAKKLEIKTSSFIFSWDNLASKGRMMGKFDYYLVWSDLMRSELLHFYPNVNNEMIAIVGTPQFEPYVISTYKTSKEFFFKKFKLNPLKKTICYSCADVSIGKNDGKVITTLANAIRDYKIEENVQLLVRTSPAEDDSRFKNIKELFPEISWNVPKWQLTRTNHSESWSQRVPSAEDVTDLRAVLCHCDININMCSTMSLDFMLFDKPVINTVFGNESNGLYNDQRFLNYDHYKNVVESGAVTIAKNENELIRAINYSLKNPEARLKQQKKILDLEIGKPIKGTSKRIVDKLFKLIS